MLKQVIDSTELPDRRCDDDAENWVRIVGGGWVYVGDIGEEEDAEADMDSGM